MDISVRRARPPVKGLLAVDISVVSLLANFGLGGVVIMLIITGMLSPKWVVEKLERENERLLQAMETERQRNAELSATTGTTARLIGALTDVALERHGTARDPAAAQLRSELQRTHGAAARADDAL